MAIAFTAPILAPSLCIATPPGQFGCAQSMETSWPGTWLLVAFFTFINVGVVGPFLWSLAYTRSATISGRTDGSTPLLWLHLILFEIGVIGATAIMAAIGFVGGSQIAQGKSAIIAAEAIRTQIIPPLSSDPASVLYDVPPVVVAMFIGLSLLAQLVGLLNLALLKPSKE